MQVFTAQQMRDFDRVAVEEYGIPSIVLMENAALRVVEFLEAKFAPLGEKKIVILCGKGNNGGDGLAIARHLKSLSIGNLAIHRLFSNDELSGDALVNAKALDGVWQSHIPLQQRSFGGVAGTYTQCFWSPGAEDNPVAYKAPNAVQAAIRDLGNADIVLDCVLGTGFEPPIRGARIRAALSLLEGTYGRKHIAVDIPSALGSESGVQAVVDEEEPWAQPLTATITFAAPKRGFFVRAGIERCGEIWVGDIGSAAVQMAATPTGVETLDLETAQRLIPKRTIDAHKGDAGRALIVGGSLGMSGAVALASRAALNSGCGLCIAAMPEKILPTFASSILEATSHPLSCDESGKLLESAADELPALWKGVQVVALGPGISRSEEGQKFVARVVRECPVPLVIDADALHALPAMAEAVKNRAADTILTPHPGEMGVLMGISASEVNDSRFETAEACAKKYGAVVVLKGARSLVATPDGRVFVNLTGNPGMATGGSGDVLTGTIAGLLAQLKNSEDATKLGVYLHGFAGDLAFEAKGNGLVAGDIAAHLGAALVEIPKREVERINGRLRKLM